MPSSLMVWKWNAYRNVITTGGRSGTSATYTGAAMAGTRRACEDDRERSSGEDVDDEPGPENRPRTSPSRFTATASFTSPAHRSIWDWLGADGAGEQDDIDDDEAVLRYIEAVQATHSGGPPFWHGDATAERLAASPELNHRHEDQPECDRGSLVQPVEPRRRRGPQEERQVQPVGVGREGAARELGLVGQVAREASTEVEKVGAGEASSSRASPSPGLRRNRSVRPS